MCLLLRPHNIGRPNAAKHLDEALSPLLCVLHADTILPDDP